MRDKKRSSNDRDFDFTPQPSLDRSQGRKTKFWEERTVKNQCLISISSRMRKRADSHPVMQRERLQSLARSACWPSPSRVGIYRTSARAGWLAGQPKISHGFYLCMQTPVIKKKCVQFFFFLKDSTLKHIVQTAVIVTWSWCWRRIFIHPVTPWLFLQREKLCRDVKYHINVEVVNTLPQTSAFQPNQGHVRNLHIVQGGFFFPFSGHAWSSSSPNSDFCVHPDLYPITGSRRPSATFSSLDEKRRRVSRVCYRTRFRIGSFRAYTCVRKRCVDSVLQLLLLYQAGWTPQLDKFLKFYQV